MASQFPSRDGYSPVAFQFSPSTPATPATPSDSPTLGTHPTHSGQPPISMQTFSYPPQGPQSAPGISRTTTADTGRQVRMPDYDAAEKQQRRHTPTPGMPRPESSHERRTGSWDILAGIRRFEHSYEEFDSRNASEAHLVFADGDVPKDKVSRLYNYLLNVSIVTRWVMFIVPVMAILWIPGILALTKFPNAEVWGVGLLWWSIWLSVAWGGWWAALAASRILPHIVRMTVGVVAIGVKRYIDWIEVLHRYVAFTAWTFAMWITFNPLINARQDDHASDHTKSIISVITKLLFALAIDAGLLLFEKFAIQWIAGKFHERSYAERIADQKFAVRSLVTLYRNSTENLGRSDTLREPSGTKTPAVTGRKLFKKALKGVRMAATTTTTAFGNVASEIAGSSVLQPNSPQAMVKVALESANKSRLLARRLFYSFVKSGGEYLLVEDIARFFHTPEEADRVYALFDKDGNGDVSRDEMELACLDFHREQLSIEHSMQDLDSAVGRLDNILMSVYVVVAILIVAIALEAQLVTIVTGMGTAVLGLSWLIGGALSDVLNSIIFLFIKHPFDVGDRIVVDKVSYTVKEIRLLSTVFLDANSTLVQAPNVVLNASFIYNIRRSPQMSESFTFDVAYATSFEDLERLRQKMMDFLENNRRDYYPSFDVAVVDFPEQEKMTLSVDIKYKSNSQQGALKAKRRNKWICALKSAMHDARVFGPKGEPASEPSVSRYTKVPWVEIQHKDHAAAVGHQGGHGKTATPQGGWDLTDKNAMIINESEDIFGEADELYMTSPRRNLSSEQTATQRSQGPSMPSAITMPTSPMQTQSSEPIPSPRRH